QTPADEAPASGEERRRRDVCRASGGSPAEAKRSTQLVRLLAVDHSARHIDHRHFERTCGPGFLPGLRLSERRLPINRPSGVRAGGCPRRARRALRPPKCRHGRPPEGSVAAGEIAAREKGEGDRELAPRPLARRAFWGRSSPPPGSASSRRKRPLGVAAVGGGSGVGDGLAPRGGGGPAGVAGVGVASSGPPGRRPPLPHARGASPGRRASAARARFPATPPAALAPSGGRFAPEAGSACASAPRGRVPRRRPAGRRGVCPPLRALPPGCGRAAVRAPELPPRGGAGAGAGGDRGPRGASVARSGFGARACPDPLPRVHLSAVPRPVRPVAAVRPEDSTRRRARPCRRPGGSFPLPVPPDPSTRPPSAPRRSPPSASGRAAGGGGGSRGWAGGAGGGAGGGPPPGRRPGAAGRISTAAVRRDRLRDGWEGPAGKVARGAPPPSRGGGGPALPGCYSPAGSSARRIPGPREPALVAALSPLPALPPPPRGSRSREGGVPRGGARRGLFPGGAGPPLPRRREPLSATPARLPPFAGRGWGRGGADCPQCAPGGSRRRARGVASRGEPQERRASARVRGDVPRPRRTGSRARSARRPPSWVSRPHRRRGSPSPPPEPAVDRPHRRGPRALARVPAVLPETRPPGPDGATRPGALGTVRPAPTPPPPPRRGGRRAGVGERSRRGRGGPAPGKRPRRAPPRGTPPRGSGTPAGGGAPGGGRARRRGLAPSAPGFGERCCRRGCNTRGGRARRRRETAAGPPRATFPAGPSQPSRSRSRRTAAVEMRPAAPGRRPGGGPPPAPPPAPPAHPRDPPPPPAARPEADGESGEGRREGGWRGREARGAGKIRRAAGTAGPAAGLNPPGGLLRWSLPPALGCIPKQPDSGKTRARRAGGRYRPHTVHGLGLDQKDLGPPRAAPGSGSSRVATSDLRSRLGGPEGGGEGAREEGPEKGETRRPAADRPGPPASPRTRGTPTDRPPPRPDYPSPLREEEAAASAAAAAAGGGRRGRGRGGAGSTSRLPRDGRGAGRRRAGRGGEGRGTRGRRSPNGRRTHRAAPISPGPRHRPRPRGGSSGARTAARPQPGGRARSGGQTPRRPAGRRRGTRPRGADAHADPASGANRPSRRGESRGGAWPGSGHGPRTHGGRGRHRGRGGGGGAGRADRKTRPPPPPPPRGPRHPVARDRPRPPTPPPGAATPRGRLRREEALPEGGRPTPEGPAGQGPRRELAVPFSLLAGGSLPRGRRAFGGTPCLHLGGRRARRALRGQPPAAHPGGAIDRQATLRQA
ncbi:PREDICTED: collagen alpha-1(III) chain-like, partial [Capra hircus]|uniref:collagen alpha-1(III) chain-like n=1 Tax=Capra hircus TaxID=9925 RepID=UPI0008467F3F